MLLALERDHPLLVARGDECGCYTSDARSVNLARIRYVSEQMAPGPVNELIVVQPSRLLTIDLPPLWRSSTILKSWLCLLPTLARSQISRCLSALYYYSLTQVEVSNQAITSDRSRHTERCKLCGPRIRAFSSSTSESSAGTSRTLSISEAGVSQVA